MAIVAIKKGGGNVTITKISSIENYEFIYDPIVRQGFVSIVFRTNICKRAGLKFQQQIFPQPNKNSYGSLPSGPFAVGNVCSPGKATVCFGIQVFEIRVYSVFYLLRVINIITSVVREGKDTVMEVKEEEGTIKTAVIEVESSPSPNGTPIRHIVCLNKTNMENLRKLEETEDCFILDFDPSEIDTSISRFSTLSVYSFSDDDGDGGELSVVAEKGQVLVFSFFLFLARIQDFASFLFLMG